MNTAAKCYLACGIDKRPIIVRIAACVLATYVMEIHRYGEFRAATDEITRLMRRFKLGDFACALFANYPVKQPNWKCRYGHSFNGPDYCPECAKG